MKSVFVLAFVSLLTSCNVNLRFNKDNDFVDFKFTFLQPTPVTVTK